MSETLEGLYTQARAALKARDYARASDLLRQILLVDENYKDASRLLAQTVSLRRRRWYNQPMLWGGLGLAALAALIIWLVPRLNSFAARPVPTTISTQTATVIPSPTPIAAYALSSTATPVPFQWARVSLGTEFPRAQITVITFDPLDPDVIYVGTQSNGIYKTINGGGSWQPANGNLQMIGVGGITVDPRDARTVLVQAAGGVYRSTDAGETWELILAGNSITLVSDVLDDSHLVAWEARNNISISQTMDYGKSWTNIIVPYINGNLTLVYGNTWYLVSSDGTTHLSLSEDEGQTWTQIPSPVFEIWSSPYAFQKDLEGNEWLFNVVATYNLNWKTYYQIHLEGQRACTPFTSNSDYGVLYGICGNVLKTSRDGGRTWEIFSNVQGGVTTLAISPMAEKTIAVAGQRGLEITRDGGLTWQPANNGIGNVSIALLADLKDVTIWYAIARVKETGPGPNQRIGVCDFYHSSDAVRTWQAFANIDQGCNLTVDGSGTLYQTEGRYISRSMDAGNTWQNFPRPAQFENAADGWWIVPHPLVDGTFFASYSAWDRTYSESPLLISRDSGITWQNTSITGNSLPMVIYQFGFSSDQNRIYFYHNSYGNAALSYTKDGGTNWSDCDPNIPWWDKGNITDLVVDPGDTNRVFAATDSQGVFLSVDGCNSWQNVLAEQVVNSLAIDPKNPEVLYAGTTNGALMTSDAGRTWNPINEGLLGTSIIYSIRIDAQGGVYAATPYGIFTLKNK
jgi:photosystem II stability/assembly factor-like uncharacterized protein